MHTTPTHLDLDEREVTGRAWLSERNTRNVRAEYRQVLSPVHWEPLTSNPHKHVRSQVRRPHFRDRGGSP